MSRAVVRKLAPYQAGTSIEEVKRRFGLERIIKLASNENPLGSSPKALAALANVDRLHLYFDDAHHELKAKLAAPYGLREEHVLLGHGSNELVNVIAETLLEAGDEAVMAEPSFSLYRLATAIQGATPIDVPLRNAAHDLDAMLAAVTPRTKLIFVCDPNNPTGTAVDAEAFGAFARALPEDVTLVVDQAYREYMGPRTLDATVYVLRRPRTIVLRTMSKAYGLAGLRFGYAFADADTVGWLERVRLPFNVSRPAALGAFAALDDREFLERTVASNEAGKTYLYGKFERLGLKYLPTEANFIAVAVPTSARAAYDALLERGIIVRSGDALRLPGFLRITIGTADENRALVTALEDLLPAWRAAT